MDKTIVVALEDRVKHPRYSKVIRRTSKVKAHDENGIAGIGDRVLLMETRPMSATKRWRLVDPREGQVSWLRRRANVDEAPVRTSGWGLSCSLGERESARQLSPHFARPLSRA